MEEARQDEGKKTKRKNEQTGTVTVRDDERRKERKKGEKRIKDKREGGK